jgi:hypothetical protein
MRGVKESVIPLVPVFMIFLLTHVFFIVYSVAANAGHFPAMMAATRADVHSTKSALGTFGMLFVILRAYSMGAGTFTGIEAVSNGLPILREPKVKTGKHTMRYMAYSLSFMVVGLMVAYLLYGVQPVHGKTLNAVLYEAVTKGWGTGGYILLVVTLVSEAILLLVAAQAGFLDGPRVLANMALDRWFPTKFATFSDRLVTQKGIFIMGLVAFLMMVITGGSVDFLVVLYSINVFITFSLSQLGMVRHWWIERGQAEHWRKKLFINGLGLSLTSFILISVVILKFTEGGWITIVITSVLIGMALLIKKHYLNTARLLSRLDSLVEAAGYSTHETPATGGKAPAADPRAKTAIVLVSGYNGLGLHTFLNVIRQFGGMYKNFVFIEVGIVDAGTFKGAEELENLKKRVNEDLDKYVKLALAHGLYAEGFSSFGTDVVGEISKVAPEILERFPNCTFFGGQLVFPNPNIFTGMLHNYTIFAVQRYFYNQGIPIMLMPVRV